MSESENRKKMPIWIPIVSVILVLIFHPDIMSMLSYGMYSTAFVEGFGYFIICWLILYIAYLIFISFIK